MEDWIFAENLQPFVELLDFLAGNTLYDDEYDWVAIEDSIKDTDADAGKWYTYTLARNLGSNVVSVRVSSDAAITAELAAQLNLLVTICQSYTIAGLGSGPLR